LVDLLRYAIERPTSGTGRALAPITEPLAALAGWTPTERAHALWQLIIQGIRDPDVSPTDLSRRRRALQAAFRLRDRDIRGPWGASLTARFKQLMVLREVFNRPTTTQPMETAWRDGVRLLAAHLEDRLRALAETGGWEQYRPASAEGDAGIDPLNMKGAIYRRPSKGAQPVFLNLFITTVFMKRRAVYRRITERLLTAQEDGVEYYTARGFAGKPPRVTYAPVQALWGCRAEYVEPSHPGRPPVTQLWLPAPLRAGEQAHFASEVIDESITEERHWIDVDIDHHGIAPGRLLYDGRLPVSGLTIRVRFDESELPEAVWWYAELNENERYDRPPPRDPHLLTITGHDVQYTFMDQPCQPRESYGLAFSWPSAGS
jgi:hypothetical protein